ncbi:alpha/beta hydrolase [Kitasatospora purpeofusca]|uniref:Alpha/beta hydrolase n=1 Tax=Kitasatospora purpeofusca TaxID=67352 RepID=A0ABZ1UAE7_9ACTN|nr:alpha/beta hydrolase [Kitasatospora purpeofusca]
MPTFPAPDGTRLAYRIVGEGDPLICLPGGPMQACAYLGDLGGLAAAAGRSLVLLDLRGTGESETPADPSSYRVDRQVDDVEALRAHLGLERIDVLAHSAAGDLTLLHAGRYPHRIRSLVLVAARARAAGIGFPPEGWHEAFALRSGEPWHDEAVPAFERAMAGDATADDRRFLDRLTYSRWDAAAQAHAALGEDGHNEEAAHTYPGPGAFDDAPAVREALAELDAPVLVLAGELDPSPRPDKAAEVAALFPRGEFVVQPGAAHVPWLDGPEFFVRTVGEFLSRSAA